MRTTLNVNDNLIKELMALYGAKTKTEAVNQALNNWINHLKKKKLLSLRGQIEFENNLEELKFKEISDFDND